MATDARCSLVSLRKPHTTIHLLDSGVGDQVESKMSDRSRGISEEELFMSHPARHGEDSPTIEPLRIFKPQSPQPADRFKYPYPVPTSSAASSSSSSSSKPAFPLPPGASSSAAPLPYPDDDDDRVAARPTRPTYATDSRKSSAASGRLHGTASPANSASGGYNDTSPRLNLSPVENSRPGLAERRGTAPRPITSPTSPKVDKDELFAQPLQQQQNQKISTAYQNKPYYPPPGSTISSSSGSSSHTANAPRPDASNLGVPSDNNMNRFPSTASNSTTKANRGSPPPPETPIVEPGNIPGGGIEARYAAAGISGTATLTSLQAQSAQSAAASQRLAQYGGQVPPLPQQPQPTRPWTPTDDRNTHSPPTVYQGSTPMVGQGQNNQQNDSSHPSVSNRDSALQVSVLEQDFQRMQASTPPPAYTSVHADGSSSSYPADKQRPAAGGQSSSSSTPAPQQSTAAASSAASVASSSNGPGPNGNKRPANPTVTTSGLGLSSPIAAPHNANHPAFANDPRPGSAQNGHPALQLQHTPSVLSQAQSPPPLPEGWIAHLDQNSGQYYYIHLATQATQWEFPKGPNPIQHEVAPLSPVGSTYGNPMASPFLGGKQPLASPLYPPSTPGYAESIMSVATATPSAAGFSGPPPSAGVDMYRITPTNGVYFGPYLRYVNMDVEKGVWLGSIMIVTDAPQPPTIHIHLSVDLSPNPRQVHPQAIFTHQRWTFYKYELELKMGEGGSERWTYAVTSHLGCTRYEFVVAGRYENGWRFIAHSGNDFSVATSQNERSKLGGAGLMWKDVLQKNVECGGFHVQLGLGDQIYGDRLWKEVPLLKQWLAMQGRENRKNVQWTARHEEDVSHAYFHYYTSHFDQPFLREAFAQIPHVLQLDDHDM